MATGRFSQHALVAGGNGGIGLGFVRQLLQRDPEACIHATYHRVEAAAELFALAETHGPRLRCLPMDVTDEAQIAAAVRQLQSVTDRLHLTVNCIGILHAGELQPEKGLRQLDADKLLRYFQINSLSGALLAKYLLPLLRHDRRNVFASLSAKIGSIGDNQLGGWYGYRASKAALNMLLRTAAIEFGRKSPQTIVVALHPGTTDTPLSQPFQRHVPAEQLFPVERTVRQLLGIIDGLGPEDSGQFFHWDGTRLPW